jgi:hypothetical protein
VSVLSIGATCSPSGLSIGRSATLSNNSISSLNRIAPGLNVPITSQLGRLGGTSAGVINGLFGNLSTSISYLSEISFHFAKATFSFVLVLMGSGEPFINPMQKYIALFHIKQYNIYHRFGFQKGDNGLRY